MYINNHQVYNSNRLYPHKQYISNSFKGAISEYKGVLHCEGYDFEANPDDIQDSPLSDPFFSRRLKMLLRSDGFTLYGKLGVDFSLTTSELQYPNMKVRIRLIRARPSFYMISDNPNVSLGNVDCSLYTRRIGLMEDYHKKRMDMLAYAPVDYNYTETLAKTFIIPSSQNQFIQENFQQGSHSSDRNSHEYKLCFHWFFHWKPVLVSTIRSQTNQNTQGKATNCRS